MPITSSAHKALRRDQRRTQVNTSTRKRLKEAIKSAVIKSNPDTLSSAYSAIDRAAKKGIIKKNKAARLKNQLSTTSKTATSTPKTKPKKAPPKKKLTKKSTSTPKTSSKK